MIDQKKPTAPIKTTYTELLKTLEFAKTVSDALEGHTTFTSDQYQTIEESLHRLHSRIELAKLLDGQDRQEG